MTDLSSIIIPESLAQVHPIVTCTVEGILEEADLRELALSAPIEAVEGDDPTDLKRIKERHHSVARQMASGLSQRMVAKLCGYTESYLSILLNNPAMQELIELYRIQYGSAAQVIGEKLKTVGMKALEALDAKIDSDGLSNQELLAAAKLGLDRSGHGPSSSQHLIQEQHIIDHAELAKRNEDARARNARQIVPASEIRAALAPPKEQNLETDGKVDTEASKLHEDRSQQGSGPADGE